MFLQRLSTADGAPAWTAFVEDSISTFKLGLAVTPDAGLLVAGGVLDDLGDRRPWVGKYSDTGDLLWSRSDYLSGEGIAMAAAVGPGGELAVGGASIQTADNHAIWLARVDGSGEVLWEDHIDSDSKGAAYSLAFGPGGELYVGGLFFVAGQGYDSVLRRYAPAGAPYWTTYHNNELNFHDTITGVAVTAAMVVAVGTEFVLDHGSNQWIRAYAP